MQTIRTQRDLSGRYEIHLVAPGSWELRRDGRPHSRHGTASTARSAAGRLERIRRFRASLLRNGLVFLLAAVGIGVAVGLRTIPNPQYAPAVAFTERLDTAFRSVMAGTQDLKAFALETDGLVGATVEGPPEFRIETADANDELPSSVPISILIGEHDETCYSIRWEEPEWPVTGILRPGLPCTPAPNSGVSSSYSQGASSTQPGVVYWDPLLPPSVVQAGWFLVVVLALLALGLWSAVGISLAFLTLRSGRGVSLGWQP